MKLSMHILNKWLDDWRPIATIISGEDELEGVRMFSPVTQPDQRYVYVAHMRDVFPENESDEIILVNRNDVIHLESRDIEEAFNEAVHAFEYYSDWEYQLLLSAASESACQNIAEKCSELFGPTLFQDRTFHILAMSAKHQGAFINPIWDELNENKSATLQLISAFTGSEFMKRMDRPNDNYVFYEERANPFSYGVLNSFNDENGNLSGQCMITFDRPPDRADLQLIGMVKRALATISTKVSAKEGNQIAEMVLSAALERHEIDEFDRSFVSESLKWKNDQRLCILVASIKRETNPLHTRNRVFDAIAERCRQKLPNSIVLSRSSELVICQPVDLTNVAMPRTFIEKHLDFLLNLEHMRIGMSMCFDSLSNCWAYYKQARAALEESPDGSGLLQFYDVATRALLRHPDVEWHAMCIHPVLDILSDHDRQNGTFYYQTLHQFLVHERSYKAVARIQFTHRNTILYRIDRIQEMFPLDLDNPETRMHLLLSFEINSLSREALFR